MGYRKANRTFIPVCCDTFNPADSTTYYIGIRAVAPTTTANYRKAYLPIGGTIAGAYLFWEGGIPTNEDISISIRKNDTTDYLIETIGDTEALKVFNNSDMCIPVARGDYIEIKIVTPAWVTNPVSVSINGLLMLQY